MTPTSITIIIVLSGLVVVSAVGGKCKNGRVSESHAQYPICICSSGFKGHDCGKKVKPCEGSPCRNNGSCTNNENGTFACRCKTGFKGILCEHEVLPCDSGPCKNGGSCTDDGLKKCFKCECAPGFKGQDCSEVVKPCEIKPCKNDGVCENQEGDQGFICKCKQGFRGAFCSKRDGLYSSEILNVKKGYIAQLEKWLGGAKSWRLCYRASDDGWSVSTFHSQCDFVHPTLTIIRSGSYIFGGYSDVAFGGYTGYRRSSNAFIFSLVNNDNLPPFKSKVYRNTGNAIYTSASYGPTFGGHDIYIANHAIGGISSYTNFGYTYQPPSGYPYGSTKAKSLLAGSYYFKPNEIETFYATNS